MEAKRGTDIPNVAQLAGTKLGKGVELDALAKLPHAEQQRVMACAKAGEKVSAGTPLPSRSRSALMSSGQGEFNRVKAESADSASLRASRRGALAQSAFKIGERVRLSERGRQRFRRMPDRPATVIGYSRFSSAVNVIFDGNKSNTSLHASYLEAEPEVAQ